MKLVNQAIVLALSLLSFSFSLANPSSSQQLLLHDHVRSQEPSANAPLLSLHRHLVEIESITENEHAVGTYLRHYLTAHNFTVELQSVDADASTHVSSNAPQRFNLLAYYGSSRDARVLLTSHIDTVPPFWPYEIRHQTEVWGRGSVDAKGSVATQIRAVQELRAADEIKDGDVALLFVVGEETGGKGMRTANALGLTWEAVIFGEPTELKLATGHKGNLGFTITAHGKAGHSGYPWLGESANSMLIPALAALDTFELPGSEKYGNTTINIGRMEGGVASNVIAELASAKVSVRLAAGTPAEARKAIAEKVASVDKRLELAFYDGPYGPVDIDHDVEGFETIVCNYGTDIPSLQGSHKRYLYGPGSILVAHSDHEHLSIQDLEDAVKGYKKLALAALHA